MNSVSKKIVIEPSETLTFFVSQPDSECNTTFSWDNNEIDDSEDNKYINEDNLVDKKIISD